MHHGPSFYIVLFFIMGLFVEWQLYRRYRSYLELRDKGQDAKAAVIWRSSHREEAQFSYRFRLPTGEEISGRREGVPDYLMNVQPGDEVLVRYLPDRPKINYLADNMGRRILSARITLIFPFVCIVILCLPLLTAER
jgi:hypothetical protein